MAITFRVTFGTPVPETAVKFVNGAGLLIVTINVKCFALVANHVLTPIESVLNVSAGSAIEVGEPLREGERMWFPLWMLPTHGFSRVQGQRTILHGSDSVEEIASRSDDQTSLQRIEAIDLFELFCRTPRRRPSGEVRSIDNRLGIRIENQRRNMDRTDDRRTIVGFFCAVV